MRTSKGCPACGHKFADDVMDKTVVACRKCNGLYTPDGLAIYLGESYDFVLPRMTAEDIPFERTRYFDFTCLGPKGVTRRHGWFDTKTRLIVQVG